MSERYAICRQMADDSDMEDEWAHQCTIPPAQAALGAMTEREIGAVLLFRHGHESGERFEVVADSDGELGADELAKELGLWPEVTTRRESGHLSSDEWRDWNPPKNPEVGKDG